MTKTIDALVEALEYWLPKAEPLPNTYDKVCEHHKNQWKKAVAALAQARAEQAEPVKFLANGTRFKMAFFDSEEDGCGNVGTYVTCFEGFDKELDGRWVALVAAEDNCHLKLTTPPAAPVAKTCDMGQMCLGCEPKRPDGGCPDAAPVAKLEPCATCESLARAVMLDQTGRA